MLGPRRPRLSLKPSRLPPPPAAFPLALGTVRRGGPSALPPVPAERRCLIPTCGWVMGGPPDGPAVYAHLQAHAAADVPATAMQALAFGACPSCDHPLPCRPGPRGGPARLRAHSARCSAAAPARVPPRPQPGPQPSPYTAAAAPSERPPGPAPSSPPAFPPTAAPPSLATRGPRAPTKPLATREDAAGADGGGTARPQAVPSPICPHPLLTGRYRHPAHPGAAAGLSTRECSPLVPWLAHRAAGHGVTADRRGPRLRRPTERPGRCTRWGRPQPHPPFPLTPRPPLLTRRSCRPGPPAHLSGRARCAATPWRAIRR